MVVHPTFARHGERNRSRARKEVGAVLRDQQNVFVENEIGDMIDDTGSSVVRYRACLAITLGDGDTTRIQVLSQFSKRPLRPVWVDWDAGSVVAEDCAGAVDDFLVA